MSKITYLLGAGASFPTLPMNDKLSKGLLELKDIISVPEFELSKSEGFYSGVWTKEDMRQQFIKSLEWLHNKTSNFPSVDTFAKDLSNQKEMAELLKLKATITAFFSLLQLHKSTDPNRNLRYEHFLTSLYDSTHELPKNVRILSWNYDSQFEHAISLLGEKMPATDCKQRLNVWESDKASGEFVDEDKFSIFKLNGTTSVKNMQLGISYDPVTDYYGLDGMTEKIVDMYAMIIEEKAPPLLKFAWEHSSHEMILKHIHDTEILIVIGYSFPQFNEEIDKKIIGSMSKLEKVYIQDINSEKLIKNFKAMHTASKNIEFEPIMDIEQFFMPYELYKNNTQLIDL